MFFIPYLVSLIVPIFLIYCQWRVYAKAGQPGWAAIIPIYNIVVLLEMTGKPVWWIILFLIPIVNLIIMIIIVLELGNRFGKSGVWSFFLLVLLSVIGWIILAFDDSVYNSGEAVAATAAPVVAPAPVPAAPTGLAAQAMPPAGAATPTPAPASTPPTAPVAPAPETPPTPEPPANPPAAPAV